MTFKKKSFNYYLREYGPYLAVIVIVLLVKQFLFSPVMVSGESMINTLKDRDIMIMDKISLSTSPIKRFEIVVITYKDRYLIKRVVGLPGETIEYKNDKLYVNGKYVKETFLDQSFKEQKKREMESPLFTNNFKVTLKKGEYYVLGDNRLNSVDSRALGTFTIKDFKARGGIILYPFNKMGRTE